VVIMPGNTRTIITETENIPTERAHVVPIENWLIKNHLLCSCGQNKESTKIELKNVGPTPRIVYKGTTIAKTEPRLKRSGTMWNAGHGAMIGKAEKETVVLSRKGNRQKPSTMYRVGRKISRY